MEPLGASDDPSARESFDAASTGGAGGKAADAETFGGEFGASTEFGA